jgi:glycosyltransferase involved in cell wall biosynthesis
MQTARHLASYGIEADIRLASDVIDYHQYDLLHFFNLARPADILYHISKTNKPFVVSPVLVDYTEYDKQHRRGMSGRLFRFLSGDGIEYFKTMARWAKGKDRPLHVPYLLKGHHKSIQEILARAILLLPNSEMEYDQLAKLYKTLPGYAVVPNGVDAAVFQRGNSNRKEELLVLCVARIEGIKNQLNLVKALNNTRYQLVIIGAPAPNQLAYYEACRKVAAGNITFTGPLPQQEVVGWYRRARVHVLPSWFETCGLATLEAAAMGCNVVVSDRGYTRAYCGDDAVYCDPASPAAILEAVTKAAAGGDNSTFREKILTHYTWQSAAVATAGAYKKAIAAL